MTDKSDPLKRREPLGIPEPTGLVPRAIDLEGLNNERFCLPDLSSEPKPGQRLPLPLPTGAIDLSGSGMAPNRIPLSSEIPSSIKPPSNLSKPNSSGPSEPKLITALNEKFQRGIHLAKDSKLNRFKFMFWVASVRRILQKIYEEDSPQLSHFPPVDKNLPERFVQQNLVMRLQYVRDMIEYLSNVPSLCKSGKRVFFGHGRSHLWRVLKDFIADELKLPWDEFNREPVAG